MQRHAGVLAQRDTMVRLLRGEGAAYLALVDAGVMPSQLLEQHLATSGRSGVDAAAWNRLLHDHVAQVIRDFGFDPAQGLCQFGHRGGLCVDADGIDAGFNAGRIYAIAGIARLRPVIATFVGRSLLSNLGWLSASFAVGLYADLVAGSCGAEIEPILRDYADSAHDEGAREAAWQTLLAHAECEEQDDGDPYIYGIGGRGDFERLLERMSAVDRAWQAFPGWGQTGVPPAPEAETLLERDWLDWAVRLNRLPDQCQQRGWTLAFDARDHRPLYEAQILSLGAADDALLDDYYETINDGSGEIPGLYLSLPDEAGRLIEFLVSLTLPQCVLGECDALCQRATPGAAA